MGVRLPVRPRRRGRVTTTASTTSSSNTERPSQASWTRGVVVAAISFPDASVSPLRLPSSPGRLQLTGGKMAEKSMIGHCLGVAGGLEAIATMKAITTGWLHPTINQFSMIGHCLGVAGGLEAIATMKAITTGWLHPTINQFCRIHNLQLILIRWQMSSSSMKLMSEFQIHLVLVDTTQWWHFLLSSPDCPT